MKLEDRKTINDVIIVLGGVIALAIVANFVFAGNPLYVVASGSMVPELLVNDVIFVQGDCFDLFGILGSNCVELDFYSDFEDVKVGDIIVFDRPSDHNRVIVHRVDSILDEDPKTVRTKGDANRASIPGTDFPITEREYIGKVIFTISQVGYVTQLLKPPMNFVLIAIVIGVWVIHKMMNRRKKAKPDFSQPADVENQHTPTELDGIEKIEKDTEYSEAESSKTKQNETTDENSNKTTEEIEEPGSKTEELDGHKTENVQDDKSEDRNK